MNRLLFLNLSLLLLSATSLTTTILAFVAILIMCSTTQFCYYFIALLVMVIHRGVIFSYAQSTTNNNIYNSITQLDQYGSSPQINNARLASTLHGALSIAAISIPSNSITVVSIERKLPGVVVEDSSSASSSLSLQGGQGKIQMICQEGHDHGQSSSVHLAVIGSGLQSDITYIVSLLRKHASECWARYDSIPSLDRITMDASQVMLCFMGYDIHDEIQDGTRGVLANDSGSSGEDDENISIARPLACNLLVLQVQNNNNNNSADIKSVCPGGIISESLLGRAIGRCSDLANDILRKKWRSDLPTAEIEKICLETMRQIIQEKEMLNEKEQDTANIVVETMTKRGVFVKRIPFHIEI